MPDYSHITDTVITATNTTLTQHHILKQERRYDNLKEKEEMEARKRKPQGDVTHKDFGGAIRPWLNGVQQKALQ